MLGSKNAPGHGRVRPRSAKAARLMDHTRRSCAPSGRPPPAPRSEARSPRAPRLPPAAVALTSSALDFSHPEVACAPPVPLQEDPAPLLEAQQRPDQQPTVLAPAEVVVDKRPHDVAVQPLADARVGTH